VRDNAPAGAYPETNPDTDAVDNSDFKWPLYQRGTTYTKANKPATQADIVAHWDTRTQSFTKGGLLQTSVYRPYPASKGKGKTTPPVEDDEVVLINKHATAMFDSALKDGSMAASDMRRNYRLVGAVWLDAPLTGTMPSFALNRSFATNEDSSTDDEDSIVAGEGRLGSTAMESFSEMEVGAGGAPSCFSCHDTRVINHNGLLLHPSKLNVSHVLSKYLDTQPRTPPSPAPTP